jgi:hypothetical protein
MSEGSPAVRVSRELQQIADELSARLEGVAGRPVAFSLFVWTEGRAYYVATTNDRAAVKALLHEFLACWDAGMPDVPAHQVN